jgi:hypothetical protein
MSFRDVRSGMFRPPIVSRRLGVNPLHTYFTLFLQSLYIPYPLPLSEETLHDSIRSISTSRGLLRHVQHSLLLYLPSDLVA